MANKLKKGDEVVVISGDHKGNKGKILQMLREKKPSNCGRRKYDQKNMRKKLKIIHKVLLSKERLLCISRMFADPTPKTSNTL